MPNPVHKNLPHNPPPKPIHPQLRHIRTHIVTQIEYFRRVQELKSRNLANLEMSGSNPTEVSKGKLDRLQEELLRDDFASLNPVQRSQRIEKIESEINEISENVNSKTQTLREKYKTEEEFIKSRTKSESDAAKKVKRSEELEFYQEMAKGIPYNREMHIDEGYIELDTPSSSDAPMKGLHIKIHITGRKKPIEVSVSVKNGEFDYELVHGTTPRKLRERGQEEKLENRTSLKSKEKADIEDNELINDILKREMKDNPELKRNFYHSATNFWSTMGAPDSHGKNMNMAENQVDNELPNLLDKILEIGL